MSKKPKLHNVNSIRVIAEYLVVRYHVLKQDNGEHGAMGLDIMSFFFVLSGFGTMYTFEPEYLTTAREGVFHVGARVACVSCIPVQLVVLATICNWTNAKSQISVRDLSNMSVVTTPYAR